MRFVGTSDRNFYDRYYFNIHGAAGVHGTDDELFAVIGVGQYPNLSVADAFVSVLWGGDHRVVRSSKTLGADRMDASVGPIRVEVLKGLEQVRVVVEPNEWGLELDAVYDGFSEAHLESRHFDRQFSRVTFDSTRFAQVGSWTGTLKVGDRELELDPRPVLGFPGPLVGGAPGGRARAARDPGHRHRGRVLLDLRAGPLRGPRHRHHRPGAPERRADHAGRAPGLPPRVGTRGRVARPARAPAPLRPGHPLGDRRHPHLLRGPREQDRRGRGRDAAALPPLLGSGYGLEPDWKHGMYQGELVVQGQSVPPADPSYSTWALTEYAAKFTYDGQVGYGMFECAVMGPHQPVRVHRLGVTGPSGSVTR